MKELQRRARHVDREGGPWAGRINQLRQHQEAWELENERQVGTQWQHQREAARVNHPLLHWLGLQKNLMHRKGEVSRGQMGHTLVTPALPGG